MFDSRSYIAFSKTMDSLEDDTSILSFKSCFLNLLICFKFMHGFKFWNYLQNLCFPGKWLLHAFWIQVSKSCLSFPGVLVLVTSWKFGFFWILECNQLGFQTFSCFKDFGLFYGPLLPWIHAVEFRWNHEIICAF